MAQLRPKALGALGSYGQNSQTSDIDLPPGFVKLGTNYYMDESGRPTARPSFVNVTLATNIRWIAEVTQTEVV